MSDTDENFQERNKDLFRGYSFKFLNFPPKEAKEFETIVQCLGAEVSDEAAFTFVDNPIDMIEDKKYYNTCFILDSMRAQEALDIENYRLYRNDIVCKLCSKEFEAYSSSDEHETNETSPNCGEIEVEVTMDIEPAKQERDSNLDSESESTYLKKDIKTKSQTIKIEQNNENDDSDSSIADFSSDEEQNISNMKNWWMPGLSTTCSKKQLCQISNCSLQPEPHLKHENFARTLNLAERRVLLMYLINNKKVQAAKGIQVYEEMLKQNYLTHRSAETLRNCFRRRILPNLDEYKLPPSYIKMFDSIL